MKNPDMQLRIIDTDKEEKIITDSLRNIELEQCIYICDIEEPNNFTEIKKIDIDKFEFKNCGEQSLLYRQNSFLDTAEFLANFSNLKVFSNRKNLEDYIVQKNKEHIDIENNLREIMPDIFGIPVLSNKFREQNFDIILNKIIELKNVSNNFENGYKYKYQTPEIKMYINELSKLILNTSEDCKNEFDEYIQTSINVSRIIADINNREDFEKIKRIAENEMLNKIGNQILQFVKEVSFEEYIRKKEEWENKKIQFAEKQGIKKANEELFIKRMESKNARKVINDIFQMLSEENISHNAYYNRLKNSTNLSKQAKREIYLKNRMRGNIDWGLER